MDAQHILRILIFVPLLTHVIAQQTTVAPLFPFLEDETISVSSVLTTTSTSTSATSSASASSSSSARFQFPSPLPAGFAKTASGKPIPCSPKNTKLNPSTHRLISECTPQAFCLGAPGSPVNATGQGICVPRLCRRDPHPFGYGHFGGSNNPPKIRVKGKLVNNDTISLPPMCMSEEFCPDNGSGCKPRLALGEKCELGRDEQCQAPQWDGRVPLEYNRAVCLKSKCV